jgi:hypothetical protein
MYSFILKCKGDPWVSHLEMSKSTIEKLIGGIRDNLIAALELDAFKRVRDGQALTSSKKSEFTSELEGKLRTHWPRRGIYICIFIYLYVHIYVHIYYFICINGPHTFICSYIRMKFSFA